jgi:hypothetical protein
LVLVHFHSCTPTESMPIWPSFAVPWIVFQDLALDGDFGTLRVLLGLVESTFTV